MTDDSKLPRYFRGDGVRGKDLLTFEEVSRIERLTSHEYRANVHVEWSYGSSGHGGFLVALIWKTIQTHFETTLAKQVQPDTIAVHVEFLRPTTTGDVIISIKDVRLGRASSVVHATLSQNGAERCVVYATNAGPKSSFNTIALPMSHVLDPPVPPIDFHAVLSNEDPNWLRYDVGRNPSIPNHTLSNVIFCQLTNPPTDAAFRRTTTQWICPRIPEMAWTSATLGILFDLNVPAAENFFDDAPHNYYNMPKRTLDNLNKGGSTYDHPPWLAPRAYATVNMSIEVKRQLPSEGERWLLARWHTKEVVEGRFDVHAEVWDPKGRLIGVAQSMWYAFDTSALPATDPSIRANGRKSTTSAKGASKM